MGGRAITVLNVAEKPSVAKSVASILSRNQGLRVRDGRSRYNRIFEFNYTIRGQPCQMLFTSVLGHLMELDFDDRYRKWHSCDPADLFQAPVHKFVPEDKKDIKRTLEEEARRCQWLILWLDCDREGENIAFEVINVCTAANPNLTIKRARFSALIDREIHQAVQNLVEPNKWFADAVDARQEIDLRIGATFTRFQTMLMKDAFVIDTVTDGRNTVLSYGPCQFPTLGFVVERYWEIQAHEPEEFWLIKCSHRSDEGVANFSWERGHLFDYTCAVIIYEMCIEEPTATVTKVTPKEKPKYPPHPLSTIELEKRASRYFRMSSERTMKVAEELYQGGFISYPRTETDNFSSRTDLHAIVQEQQGHPEWGIYAQRLLDPGAGLWRNPRGGGHDDQAHPPIHPTKFSAGESGWSQDHRKLYELVVRHFLACVSKPALGAETTVEIDIAGERFSACGRVILERNYLDIYIYDRWDGSMIPNYAIGEQFIPTTLTLDPGKTNPPPLLSEADLLSRMDKECIGTDATMHDHIKKLLDRFYATKDANMCFTPTNLGEALVMGYDDMGYKLWKPDLRAVMERDMKSVSEGNKSKAEVLDTSLQQMKTCFLDARLNKVKLLEAMAIFFERLNRVGSDEQNGTGVVVRRCRLCQESDMVLKKNRDGNFMVGCRSYPQCRSVVWLPGSISEAVVTTNACNNCTPGPVYLIQFKFQQLKIPPSYNVNHLGCIGGCDEILTQLTEICGTGSRMPARGRGPTASTSNVHHTNPRSTASTSNAHHTNPRQAVCSHCQETGHSSNDCPSQTRRSRNPQYPGMNQQNGESSVACSSCGTPCGLQTANTDSNRGRDFYSCQTQGCRFFVRWVDDLNNGSEGRSFPRSNSTPASNRGRNGGRGSRGRGRNGSNSSNGTFVSATGDPISDRRCYTCGDPSHFANVCPNRGGL
ncbi:putative DNA topoisomerase transcription factor interactor and regulator CCHC(Zn) family [Medicago truncatula]|uniref:DNA topoisomerase n=1 Tax=Medicago truncatula TaxID=3880 RepID=A0A396IZ64_MEDTR|nr:DNA topoisomerase 3-alpha isoform X1 [Medicago truncatula]RHN69971.1 putative DNA topoisomerase transcription factor interactor and regulator CCHC(Zn) family [Medicago truncatula]